MHTNSKLALTASAAAVASLMLFAGSALAQDVGGAPAAVPAPVAQTLVVVVAPPFQPPVAAAAAVQAPPAVSFSGKLVAAAAAFETYTGRAATIKADFSNAEAVSTALRAGSAYELRQMQSGEVAFAAIVALQDAAFVQGVRDLARDPRAAEVLLHDPAAVASVAGADTAAARVSAALRERGARVLAVGEAVKQSAYDMQHQPWSLVHVADPQQVLAQSKALSAMEFSPAADDTARLIKLAAAAPPPANGDSSVLSLPVVQHGLALAALAVLGQAGEGSEAQLAPLLADAKGVDCMHMAKLNLYQCLAVAGPQYEDAFCLGQHALMDTGQCVIASATPKLARPVQLASRADWSSAHPSTGGAMLIPVASVSSLSPQP